MGSWMMALKVLKTSASVLECVAAKAAKGKEWKARVASSAYSRDVQGFEAFLAEAVGVRLLLDDGRVVVVDVDAGVGGGATGAAGAAGVRLGGLYGNG